MINKLMAGTMTAALLFGGAFQINADASASTNNSQNQQVYYSINGNDSADASFGNGNVDQLLNKKFPQINWNWNQQQTNSEQPDQHQKRTEKQDQPEQQDQSEQQTDKQPTGKTESQAPQQTKEQQTQQKQSASQQLNEFEQQVVELTNEERTAQGLEPLKADKTLSKVAREKSRDMSSNNYFSHDSPNYGSPFDMMKQYGISYQTAGENIAKGQRTPEAVVNGWMNSEGHRENIMNPDFTHIGVGYIEQGNYWTQEFIGK